MGPKGRPQDLQVRGISFSVRRSEIFGLLGPNGAGTSATVRALTTLTHPDSGRVVVVGTPDELKALIRGDTVMLEVEGSLDQAAVLLRPVEGVLEVIANGAALITRMVQGATAVPTLITTLAG